MAPPMTPSHQLQDLADAWSDDEVWIPAIHAAAAGPQASVREDESTTTAAATAASGARNRVLRITGLSPAITYNKLLGKIRDVGKVYSLRIISSLLPGTPSIAAGVVMWDWEATRRLAMQVEDGLLNEPGFEAGIEFASAPFTMQTRGLEGRSRVLLIRGHPNVVRQATIVGFLRETLTFDLDQVDVRREGRDRAVMEIRFGGYQRQSELAYQKLTTDAEMASQVTVAFGVDPCDRR